MTFVYFLFTQGNNRGHVGNYANDLSKLRHKYVMHGQQIINKHKGDMNLLGPPNLGFGLNELRFIF